MCRRQNISPRAAQLCRAVSEGTCYPCLTESFFEVVAQVLLEVCGFAFPSDRLRRPRTGCEVAPTIFVP